MGFIIGLVIGTLVGYVGYPLFKKLINSIKF